MPSYNGIWLKYVVVEVDEALNADATPLLRILVNVPPVEFFSSKYICEVTEKGIAD